MNEKRESSIPPDGMAGDFWDAHYHKYARVWSGRPNTALVDFAASLLPGQALDLGCGEGSDAIWLAAQGWRVSAVDVSQTALARAAQHAEDAGVRASIGFARHDLEHQFPAGRFDLVSAQYLHSPVQFAREQVLKTAADAVADGGLLLIVAHASVAPWSWADPGTVFPTAQEALDAIALDPALWRPVFVGLREREASGPAGQIARVTDSIIALRAERGRRI